MTRSFLALTLVALALPALAHDPIEWNGSTIHVLLDKDATGGSLGMFTSRFPGPGGPPRHVHNDAGEAFYVLEGGADFLADGEVIHVSQGEAVFVQKGVDHTFHLTGDSGGKILVIVTPGGFEGFFEATKHLKLPDDMDELNRISAEFGQIFTGPPLAAQ